MNSDNSSSSIIEDDAEVSQATESLNSLSLTEKSMNIESMEVIESTSSFNPAVNSTVKEDEAQEDDTHDPQGFEVVQLILKSCSPDLTNFLEKCKVAMICNSCIPSLTREDVNALFQSEIGIRSIFFW